MLTVFSLPLSRDVQGNDLLALYRDGLVRNWSPADRLAAEGLRAVGLGGWSPLEKCLLSPAVRRRGLSMGSRRGVHRLLNPGRSRILRHKQLFARRMMAAGLPVPDTFVPGDITASEWVGRHDSIILKPSFSSKGRKVSRMNRVAEGWQGAQLCSERQLTERLGRFAARQGCVQEALETAAPLQQVSPGALPTLRLVTCLDEHGEVEVASSVMRLSRDAANPVDNFNAGNLACAVSASGELGPALGWSRDGLREFRNHPVTGARIVGTAVPSIRAAMALARAAHMTVAADFRVVGWDVGISSKGPVIVEGNWNPGTDIVQMVAGRGLDDSRLGELYRWHLARLAPEDWRSARPLHFSD